MKQYRNLLLALPLIVLAGCNSSSNGTHKAKVNKPVADYKFTESALGEIIEDREDYFEGMRLTYGNKSYNEVQYAEGFGNILLIAKLVDDQGQTIDVAIYNDRPSCYVYFPAGVVKTFDCSANKRSVGNDKTLIQSKANDSHESVTVEYYNEAFEALGSMGSTVLNTSVVDGKVNIVTSFAFDDIYREITPTDDARNRSTLGVTTFLQLKEIVNNHIGQEMTVKFDSHIGGSGDDDINMYTGLMIHKNNMNTVVTKNGSVFSGGTDLFAAGKTRTLQRAKQLDNFETLEQIGVHSWGTADKTAKDFPYTDESHRKQATYFNTVMGDKGIDFYLFTLDSAPFNGQHWITKADSDKYQFITNIE
ncbi:alpha/beta hydrolase [Vibrio sp. Isolate30]|uniref:alpha/beta hydrolase n=1 Tax=Vibrio sp. Isolate30 TaxID=2908536 RepID=UPI001EFE3103|nr:alpha/beta hydrolase [Vibrio sp. Isolate30]MCG9630632.1 alpha/beta hydrolase [Vibrio sp. Isolate30]